MLGRRGPEPPPQSMLGDGHPHISKDRTSPTPTPSPTPNPETRGEFVQRWLRRSGTLWCSLQVPPHCGGLSQQVGKTVKMRRRENGGGRETGWTEAAGGRCVGGGPGESGAQRPWPLARGVDVQLALENVVDDWLGQVIHDVAIPVLQSQPG